MIEFKVQPTFADYRTANWLIFRRTWFSGLPFKMGGYLLLFFSLFQFIDICLRCGFETTYVFYVIKESLPIAIGFPIFLMLLFAAGTHFGIRRTFDALGTVDLEVDYRFSESGFFSECAIGTTNFEWRHLTDFVHDRNILILRRTPWRIYLIPLGGLPVGTGDRLIALLRAGGVKET